MYIAFHNGRGIGEIKGHSGHSYWPSGVRNAVLCRPIPNRILESAANVDIGEVLIATQLLRRSAMTGRGHSRPMWALLSVHTVRVRYCLGFAGRGHIRHPAPANDMAFPRASQCSEWPVESSIKTAQMR